MHLRDWGVCLMRTDRDCRVYSAEMVWALKGTDMSTVELLGGNGCARGAKKVSVSTGHETLLDTTFECTKTGVRESLSN